MMSQNPPTTDRARRQRGVDTGARTDAVDRVPDPPDPGGRGRQTPSRSGQNTSASDLASELGIDRSGIGTTERIGGETDIFLRSSGAEQFGDVVQSDFAEATPFVSPADVTPSVDADAISADPQIAPDRRDDVEQRAVEQTAPDIDFVTPADLDADVGASGVTGFAVPEGRRDDVEQRAVEQTAADLQFVQASDLDADVTSEGVTGLAIIDERRDDVADRVRSDIAGDSRFVRPGDVDVEVGRLGVESAGLSDAGRDRVESRQAAARRRARRRARNEARREAASELDSEFGDVDISTGDLTRDGDSFGLNENTQREIAASEFDAQTPDTDISPGDITDSGDGFGLDFQASRRVAASSFERDLENVDEVYTSWLEPRGDGFRLNPAGEQLVATANIDAQLSAVDIGFGDVTRDGDSFGLSQSGRRKVGANELTDELGTTVEPGDVTLSGDEVGLSDDFVDNNPGVFD